MGGYVVQIKTEYWKCDEKDYLESNWKRCELDEEAITTKIELYPASVLAEISIKMDENGFISFMNIKKYDEDKD